MLRALSAIIAMHINLCDSSRVLSTSCPLKCMCCLFLHVFLDSHMHLAIGTGLWWGLPTRWPFGVLGCHQWPHGGQTGGSTLWHSTPCSQPLALHWLGHGQQCGPMAAPWGQLGLPRPAGQPGRVVGWVQWQLCTLGAPGWAAKP